MPERGVATPDGAPQIPDFGRAPAGVLATSRLIELRTRRLIGPFAHRLLRYLSGVELPSEVRIGPGLVIHHQAYGLVVHPRTRIGSRVHVFHGVTIGVGRDGLWEPKPDSAYGPIVVEDDVWLCAGAIVLAGEEELRIGRGTVVGAGSLLRQSTGPWEVWAGSPARCVGTRRPSVWVPPHARDAVGAGVVWLADDMSAPA